MHRRGVPKSATHHRERNQRPISYSKKARSTMHSTCSTSVQTGRAANNVSNRISSQPIYQRIPACTLGKRVRKSEPYLENPALHLTIKSFIFSALRKRRQPQTSRP